jgi:uroporphyrin-III C-methyltransferase/precorrin-2 dehydrogenase/sirohydrochlorin ferrochelatase
VSEDDPNARLAILVLEDDAEANAAASRLKARGILVNAVDRPSLCDFTLPAIVDRDPVLIAIGTGGASAGLAKAMRLLIEALLPPSLGGLASALAKARSKIRVRWPDARDRRHAIDTALAPGGPLDPLWGADAGAVDRWLAQPENKAGATVETILIRSDDPDDLTLREARLLGRADRIVHDSAVPAAILDRARADAVRTTGDSPAERNGLTIILKWNA